jgi:Domain of unknown function (DUF4407)
MGRLLIWLSGARPEILRRCPTDRAKYLGLGSAILITATMAAVSMTFALHTALRLALPVAIPFAVAWGLAIMSLDRWLVVSLQRQDNWWNYIPLATVRLALGLLFGIIISTPFVLQIFHPEISQKITEIQNQRLDAYFAGLRNDPLSARIAAEAAKVKSLQDTIKANGTGQSPQQSPEVQGLIKLRNQAEAQASSDLDQFQCQLYGPCQPTGYGPVARADQARYLADERLVGQYDGAIKSAEHNIGVGQAQGVAQAVKALPAAQNALQDDRRAQAQQTAVFEKQNTADTGLLISLQALDMVTDQNSALNLARWLLFLLFTTIECLPILVKILLNLGPENTYEKLLALEEKRTLRVGTERTTAHQHMEVIDTMSKLEARQRLIAERNAAMPELIQKRIAAEKRVELAAVQDWEARAMRRVNLGQWRSAWNRPEPGPDPSSSPGQGRNQPAQPPQPPPRRWFAQTRRPARRPPASRRRTDRRYSNDPSNPYGNRGRP